MNRLFLTHRDEGEVGIVAELVEVLGRRQPDSIQGERGAPSRDALGYASDSKVRYVLS